MRDLEKQIAEWRRTMAKASGHREELLDELEAHLRDEMERLRRGGASPDEVFQVAVSKLGAPSALAAEFDKLMLSRRGQWLPVKLARIFCIVAAVLLAVVLPVLGEKKGLLLASHVVSVTFGYLTMFIIGGLANCYVCAQWLGEPGPTQQYSLRRSIIQFAHVAAVLTAVGTILAMFWARDQWGRYWNWDPKEIGALFVLGWAMTLSGLRWVSRANQATVIFMAILANVITALAWFGTAGSVDATGTVLGMQSLLARPWLIVFIVVQFLFLAAGVVRPAARRVGQQ